MSAPSESVMPAGPYDPERLGEWWYSGPTTLESVWRMRGELPRLAHSADVSLAELAELVRSLGEALGMFAHDREHLAAIVALGRSRLATAEDFRHVESARLASDAARAILDAFAIASKGTR